MTPPPKRKLRLRWRILIGAAASFAILLAATLVWMAWDEKEPDLSDVLPRPRVDARAQANWAQLLAACQAMKRASETWKTPDELTEGSHQTSYTASGQESYLTPVDFFFAQDRPREELQPLVSALESELPALDAALALDDFEFPLPKTFDETGDISPRDAATALGTLGRFYLKFGNQDDAVRMVRRQFRLADCIAMSEGDLATAGASYAVRSIGLNTLQHLVDSQKPDREQLAAWLALSEQARPATGPFAETFRVELFRSLLLLDEVRHGYIMDKGRWRKVDLLGATSLTRLLVRPNETRRMLGEITRLGIRQLELPANQHDPNWQTRYEHQYRLRLGDRFRVPRPDNLGGRLFVQIAAPPPVSARIPLVAQTVISAKQAAWAALAYQRAQNKLPADLGALVPDYLPAVPRDYLGAGPISYDPERGVIWSPMTNNGERPRRDSQSPNGIPQWLLPEPKHDEDAENASLGAND